MRVLLTGASGQLGAYLVEALVAAGHEVEAWNGGGTGMRSGVALRPVDLRDVRALEEALARSDPTAVLHAAAVSSAEEVRRDPGRARVVNIEATARIADWCARRGRRMVFTSTDLVFDGTQAWNCEEDPAEPVLAYGRTKREAEQAVLTVSGGLAARISLLYGPTRCGREGYYDRTLAGLRRGEPQTFFEDEFRTPLDLASAARILAGLVGSDATGLLHVGGPERVSRYELVRRIALALGLDAGLVRANRQADAVLAEPRPADVSLDSSRLARLWPELPRPTIEEAAVALAAG